MEVGPFVSIQFQHLNLHLGHHKAWKLLPRGFGCATDFPFTLAGVLFFWFFLKSQAIGLFTPDCKNISIQACEVTASISW